MAAAPVRALAGLMSGPAVGFRSRTLAHHPGRKPQAAAGRSSLTVGVGGAVTAELQASLAVSGSCLPSTGGAPRRCS
jgi:hypothetical protein